VRHCRKPRWWKPVPAKEEETWRILELIDQVAQGKQGEGQERELTWRQMALGWKKVNFNRKRQVALSAN